MPHAAPNEPGVNACCQVEENLKEIERRATQDSTGQDAGPFVTYQCQVCQRNHYVHEVKPFHIGMTMVTGAADADATAVAA